MTTNIWIIIALAFSVNVTAAANSDSANTAVRPTADDIKQLATAAIAYEVEPITGAQISIQAHTPNARVKLPLCSGAIRAEVAAKRAISRNNTVKISCDSPELDYPWQIFVAVKVDIRFPVVVARRPINVGELLTSEMLDIAMIEKSQLRGEQFSELEPIIGSRSKRRISQASPVFIENLCFVCEGDSVTIIAKSTNFTIRTQGVAESNGVLGEHIQIKNAQSQKLIKAVVTKVGTVEINM
ncbi:MAG: flagellar basal body P-ring formation chaperone FlgA [Shewanella sp.]